MAFLTINGYPLPAPKRGVSITVTTAVNSARNANAVVVAQKIGRDQYKIDGLEWTILDADTWHNILSILNDFFVWVTFVDPVTNRWVTRKMYCGDRDAKPWMLDDTGAPTLYTNCKFNLIDTGA